MKITNYKELCSCLGNYVSYYEKIDNKRYGGVLQKNEHCLFFIYEGVIFQVANIEEEHIFFGYFDERADFKKGE